MSWVALVVMLVTYALLPAFFDVLVLHKASGAEIPTQQVASDLVLGSAFEVMLVVVAITAYGWWTPVLHEPLRTRRWLWVIPGAFLVASLVKVDYGRLAQAGLALSLTLLVATLLIAVSEELAFRGMVLTFLRDRYREWVAAAITALLFGAFHVIAGPVHVVMSAIFGYLLYFVRRVSGGILLPIVVHAAWDLAVFSGLTTTSPATDPDTGLVLTLISFALLAAVLVGHRAIGRR
jgi:membrane protease YdiL (CAAX protease family)